MMINAELYVKDLPGQLICSLEPLSRVNGNIVGVVHDREQKVNNRICINVTFEVKGTDELDKLKDMWKSGDVIIAQIGSVFETYSVGYMFVGNFNASTIENLMNEASSVVSFESKDVSYSSSNDSPTKTAMLLAEVLSKKDLDKLGQFLTEACKKSDIMYIRGL